MLDIGWSELLVVAVVAIIVVGPKDLPRMMRTFGHYAGKLRRAASDFRRQFEDAMAESEAEEVRRNIESIRAGLGSADLGAAADRPIMMPTTPAPASIEQAIPPEAEPSPASRPAKKKPAAKPKARASTNKTPAKKPNKAPKKTAAKRKSKIKSKSKSKARRTS